LKATLIIPALDEGEVIGGLVARVPREFVEEVIVVDNGSSDATAREAAYGGARVVAGVLKPLPVLLLIVYFGIKGSALFRPIFGPDFDLPRFWAGVLGLSMYTSAVLAEIIRAGIVSLPRGQTEAARALGLSHAQTMRSVILPQALQLMVPAMMAQLTTVIKDTSLVGTIGVFELLKQGRTIYTQFFNPIEVLLIVATIYFVICFALSHASRRLEVGRAPRVAQVIRDIELRDQAA